MIMVIQYVVEHMGSNLHYLTSLKILSTTDSNNITNAHQIYDFEHK